MKLITLCLAIMLAVMVGPAAMAQAGTAPRLVLAPTQTASIVSAPAVAATPPAYPGSIPTDAGTDTNGTLVAAWIIWAVIGVVVAVTVFLVWRTRPKRG